jgi:capsular polysaccharide biosynthesis protein
MQPTRSSTHGTDKALADGDSHTCYRPYTRSQQHQLDHYRSRRPVLVTPVQSPSPALPHCQPYPTTTPQSVSALPLTGSSIVCWDEAGVVVSCLEGAVGQNTSQVRHVGHNSLYNKPTQRAKGTAIIRQTLLRAETAQQLPCLAVLEHSNNSRTCQVPNKG